MKKIVIHIFFTIGILFVCLGIPILMSDGFSSWIHGGDTDAVSSATSVVEQPSGACTVFINRSAHPDEETLAKWCDFFEGKEIPVLFEDITCGVISNDQMGLEMAQSFQSRLPEHQMTIAKEDGVLLLSKAEFGKFDVLLISDEIAGAMRADTLYSDEEIQVVHVTRREEEKDT